MKQIMKHEITADTQSISMHKGAEILAIRTHSSKTYIWTLEDPSMAREFRTFRVYRTGQQIDGEHVQRHRGTTSDLNGNAVRHVFEVEF